MQTIHMKFQVFFTLKNDKMNRLSSATIIFAFSIRQRIACTTVNSPVLANSEELVRSNSAKLWAYQVIVCSHLYVTLTFAWGSSLKICKFSLPFSDCL